jgi:hypothetical protein
MHNKLLLILTLCILSSCITQLDEALNDFERQLVVEGGINNEPGPYQVQLNYTGDVLGQVDRIRVPVTDAIVTLEDIDEGFEVNLNMVSPGIYETTPGDIQGEVGKSYRLRFSLSDGSIYESSIETIPELAEVSDAEVNFEVIEVQDELNEFRTFTIQQHTASISISNQAETSYYKIEAIGTEQRLVTADPGLFPPDGCEEFFFGETSQGFTTNCWQFLGDLSNGIRLISNEPFDSPTIEIDALTVPFNNRGSFFANLNVKGISSREYEFWTTLNKQNNLRADIFTPPLEAVAGNVFSNTNDDEVVVGYFSAHSIVQQNVCIDRLNEQSIRPIPLVIASCFQNCLTLFPNSTWEAPGNGTLCR